MLLCDANLKIQLPVMPWVLEFFLLLHGHGLLVLCMHQKVCFIKSSNCWYTDTSNVDVLNPFLSSLYQLKWFLTQLWMSDLGTEPIRLQWAVKPSKIFFSKSWPVYRAHIPFVHPSNKYSTLVLKFCGLQNCIFCACKCLKDAPLLYYVLWAYDLGLRAGNQVSIYHCRKQPLSLSSLY